MHELRCLDLSEANELCGGKAESLGRLKRYGLNVPAGFVIPNAQAQFFPADLSAHYQRLGGGSVAVRSSADGEDSADTSFAGQYETILNVEGIDALKNAISECVRSLDINRASAYRQSFSHQQKQDHDTPVQMHVVVQCMVDAKVAGVLFTVDPVSGRRDHIVLDAVPGLGEKLVSGTTTPDHYVVTRNNTIVQSDIQGTEPTLTLETISTLVSQACDIEKKYGQPMDLEWAIDQQGNLFWLQARPITALPADPNELDATIDDESDVYILHNIGEAMPNAVTPLTISTTGRCMDLGQQLMHIDMGMQDKILDNPRFSCNFYGRFFQNLTATANIASYLIGINKDTVALSLCGHRVAELKLAPKKSVWIRLRNGWRYAQYMTTGPRAHDAFRNELTQWQITAGENAKSTWKNIDACLPKLTSAYQYHMASTGGAAVTTSALLQILARGKTILPEHHVMMANLIAGAQNVESVDIAHGIHRIVEAVFKTSNADYLANLNTDELLEWLRSDQAGIVRSAYESYLQRHGHRAIEELEMRQTEWQANPLPLLQMILANIHSRRGGNYKPVKEKNPTPLKNPLSRWFIGLTQRAIQRREATKSMLVEATTRFKRAYRILGEQLQHEGLLNDNDSVFFLTHDELGHLVTENKTDWADKAIKRRTVYQQQLSLQFPDISIGKPEPVANVASSDACIGTPVSQGLVTGFARVVHTLLEANDIKPGEILITPVTDVCWSPYFAVIGGLVTEKGSAVSHGAVVAREYGIPAVVNLKGATQRFKTGDRVVLDGFNGTLTKCAKKPSE